MTMNGIDTSSYQGGLDYTKVPLDFAIVKATQGTTYTNPDCVRSVEQLFSAGKKVGVYHYISGGNAVAEANFFIDSILNWIGRAMICLDWESNQNSAWGNESYLDQVVNQVIARTNIPPVIYVQASRYSQVAAVANRYNCGLWIAQYANDDETGYQAHPWNEDAYFCAIRQYSSNGRLANWSGPLDLDLFYGDAAAWDAYANPNGASVDQTPAPAPAPSYVILDVDGSCGPATIRRWQQVMGTTVDGVISGQLIPDQVTYRRPNLVDSCVNYGGYGSELIRKVQETLKNEGRYFGAIDGLLGPGTIKGIQAHYGISQDASFGPDTVRHLQQALNENRF